MDYVINLRRDIKEILTEPQLVDVIEEFVEATGISPADIDTFYPDMHKGGSWVFDTKFGAFTIQQAHTPWYPDVVTTEVERLD